ncbi:MAG: cytochrome-c peroxidase [Bacteroidetes bacterium]|nr:MAG: cytochrome-c peroxidase [Bacteroidota bacterium]
MKNYKLIIILILSVLFIFSCKKDNEEQMQIDNSYVPTPLAIRVPAGWPQPVIPAWNETTLEGVRLGRMLFYDPILSSNGLSCSSCHPQNQAFAVPFRVNSAGDTVSIPPLVNLAWNPDFEWLGQEPILEHVPLADFGPEFFNTNMDTLVKRIKAHQKYPQYFREAFNINDVSTLSDDELQRNIANAISQFIRTIISDGSKFDKVSRHETAFTAEEMDGASIFYTERGDCFHCHGTPLFTNNTFNNTGLDSVLTGQNLGRYLYTGITTDKGKFSAPSLRNIELTAPYMHDSRFQTLEEVVEFYNSGVHWNSPNIDPIMTKPFKEYGLLLSAVEKADLVAFLKTLTDTTLLSNPAISNPH